MKKKKEIGISNEQIYEAVGISRQAYYKGKKKSKEKEETQAMVVQKVEQVRLKHKKMGSRLLYTAAQISEIKGVGITKFEKLMSELNLVQKLNRKWVITTIPVKHQYPNLINGLVLQSPSKVVVGDITYYHTEGNRYYIFTLKDMYSKRVLGLYGSDNMKKEIALAALAQMFEVRSEEELAGLIHHTDAGTQYLSNAYKEELRKKRIQISVAKNCLQNGAAEQLNGVVKNDYLDNYVIKNTRELNKALEEIKDLINREKPVAALKYKTPIEFEEYILGISEEKRPKVELYNFTKTNNTEGGFEKA